MRTEFMPATVLFHKSRFGLLEDQCDIGLIDLLQPLTFKCSHIPLI